MSSIGNDPQPGRRLARSLRTIPLYVWGGITVVAILILLAAFAGVISPYDPTDIRTYSLLDSELPPFFLEGGDPRFLLGTDNQGRDLLSAMLYGLQVSVLIGGGAVLLSALVGVSLGLIAGYFGGPIDTIIMRLCDVILSLPTILVALLISGAVRALYPGTGTSGWAPFILVIAISVTEWVQYCRTVRAATMVETQKDYVRAVRVMGLPSLRIMSRHILPNVLSSVIVIATISLAVAIMTEATLSFLGIGMPPTYPSLGTLIRVGNQFIFSGIWWVVVFPAGVLVVLVLSINILGDWLRDRLNPRLSKKG